jgi:alkanesulfonate monooxygenase SsuD/methylene tetrahydromethanopterin reductase-like flavin-dependent oxidoreductase (luciferase family)
LRFGIQMRPQRTSWQAYRDGVQMVEELGFDTVWNSDHLLPASGPADGPRFETLTTLGAMAAITSRVRIGALTFGNLYRDPVTLAKSATMVDHISGGRLEFAIGAAWGEREFMAYGFPYPSLSERYARLNESLRIVKSLWVEPRTSFEGHFYRVDNAPCEPKPLQQPHPPIIVGGVGTGALRIAAEHGTGSNMYGSPRAVAKRVAVLRKICQELGRDFGEIELSLHSDLALSSSHDAAEEIFSQAAAQYGEDIDRQRNLWLVGTPTDVITEVASYADIGISHWIVHFDHPFDEKKLRFLRDEVVLAFR